MNKLINVIALLALVLSGSAQVEYAKGLDFDDAAYASVPQKAKLSRGLEVVPAASSLKMFAPSPANQGEYGTCTSWAVAYCGRTILDAIRNDLKDTELITKNAYSAQFLFRLLKPEDSSCTGGSSIAQAFLMMKEQGVLKRNDLHGLCFPKITTEQLAEASDARIKDYMRLFDLGDAPQIIIQSVRKSISEKKPVVIGLNCPNSFMSAGEVWNATEDPALNYGGHALCVVGYDDNKYGGAFEIQNSWGTNWGNKGYIWIKYSDFTKFAKYAFQFVDLPEPKQKEADLSGQIKLLLSDGNTMPVSNDASVSSAVYRTTNAYGYGTRFRILISNNEPAYVYAFSTDLSNAVVKIFPYNDGISAALTDRKNEVPIPDEDHYIQFDDKPGTDILCVLYSRDELNLNDLVKTVAQQEGTFQEKIFAVLGDKLVDTKNISYAKGDISFKGFSKGKSIVPLIVEMEHF